MAISASVSTTRLSSASVAASAATRMDAQCLRCLSIFRLVQSTHVWIRGVVRTIYNLYLSLESTEALRQKLWIPRHYWAAPRLSNKNSTEALLRH